MASFYDDASLVVIPSGYKTSKIYAEKPTDGSGDLTFTRASGATRVASNGLIEKVRTNLVLYSQDASNATWSKTGCTVTADFATAPDGTQTADKLVFGASGNEIIQALSGLTSGAEYTFSFYAKTESGTYDFTFGNVSFSLTSATATTSWQRFTVTQSAAATTRYPKITATSAGTLIVWGFQVESGVATAYIPTTTAAVSVGPVNNVPRLDYLGSSCPRLLLEPQRTNLALWSEQFNNANWIKSASGTGVAPAVTANNAVSPDGYTSADTVVFNAGAGTTASDFSLLSESFASTTATHTASFYAKTASGTAQLLWRIDGAGYEKITITNQWQRFTLTKALTGASNSFELTIRRGLAEPLNASATVQLWGAQVEAGAYATSYIPTLGASVTRVTDTYQKAGFGNTSTSGTLFYEMHANTISGPNGEYILQLFAGSSVTDAFYAVANGVSIVANGTAVMGYNGAYSQVLFTTTPAANATVKIAIRYNGTNIVAFVNGVKGTVYTDTSVGAKNAIRVNNGERSTHGTKQLLFFPTALTDAQCIELTTL